MRHSKLRMIKNLAPLCFHLSARTNVLWSRVIRHASHLPPPLLLVLPVVPYRRTVKYFQASEVPVIVINCNGVTVWFNNSQRIKKTVTELR